MHEKGRAVSDPAFFVLKRQEKLPQGDRSNDGFVWRIRSFWMLICPSKFVFDTVTVQFAGVYLVFHTMTVHLPSVSALAATLPRTVSAPEEPASRFGSLPMMTRAPARNRTRASARAATAVFRDLTNLQPAVISRICPAIGIPALQSAS